MTVSRFAFESAPSQIFGQIYRPVIPIKLWSEATRKWRTVHMLLDTGADYTIIPSYIAVWLELDLHGAKEYQTVGVGGKQTIRFIEKLRVKVGHFEREIPVGIIQSTSVPPLMGRHGMIDTFDILLSKRKEIVFTQ